jgi:hypothetical protein
MMYVIQETDIFIFANQLMIILTAFVGARPMTKIHGPIAPEAGGKAMLPSHHDLE